MVTPKNKCKQAYIGELFSKHWIFSNIIGAHEGGKILYLVNLNFNGSP